MGFCGAISDVDGVLVDSPHERAWRDALRQLMDTDWRRIRDRTTYSPERFTPKVYLEVMADKRRPGGATAGLTYFKVPDAVNRAEAYGERKQQRVVELIEVGEFHAFPDALRFALAAASSSKNVGEFLKRISLDVFAAERGLPYDFIHEGMTLLNVFDADISGRAFEHGQHHPVISLDDVALNALSETRLDRATIR